MRMITGFCIMSFLLLTNLSATSGEPKDTDTQRLQGTWRFREMQVEVTGAIIPPRAEVQKWRWIINGNKLTWVCPGKKPSEESLTLDSTKKPKWIDLTETFRIKPLDEKDRDPKNIRTEKWRPHGIYQLDGNSLKVCVPIPYVGSGMRPVEFTAKSGSGCMVYVLERETTKK